MTFDFLELNKDSISYFTTPEGVNKMKIENEIFFAFAEEQSDNPPIKVEINGGFFIVNFADLLHTPLSKEEEDEFFYRHKILDFAHLNQNTLN